MYNYHVKVAESMKRQGYANAVPMKYTNTLSWYAEWGLQADTAEGAKVFIGLRFLTEQAAQAFCDEFNEMENNRYGAT